MRIVNKDKYYVYENGAWRAAANDQEIALGVCTTAREGVVAENGGTYYICKSKTWTTATALEYDTYGWNAGEEGEMRAGSVNIKECYEYKNGVWAPCLGSFLIDSRDGKIYRTVTIGTQTWMAENLNYADSIKTPSLLERSWCYENSTDSCAKYGRLYTWAAAIDSVKLATDADNPQDCGYSKTCTLPDTVRGVCPEGWHLPRHAEWVTLITKVGGTDIAGQKLKSQSGWNENGNGTDSEGSSALPAGERFDNGNFAYSGIEADFWRASSTETDLAGVIELSYKEDVRWPAFRKCNGLSVRCIKDK